MKLPDDVHLGDDLFRVNLGYDNAGRPIVASITLLAEARQRLCTNCTHCGTSCEHIGAAFALVLEEKTALGLGQTQPVQVFVLVTEETIEENLLATISAKRDLALAALDPKADQDEVEMISGMDQLKQRLEILLGAKAEEPLDVSQQAAREEESLRSAAHKERVAAAGGEMLGAAFKFLGELVASQTQQPAAPALAGELCSRLAECIEEDGTGRQRLTVTLPDKAALHHLADALAQLLAVGK